MGDLNPQLSRTQFADIHGHGWVYRAVYKKDRKGQPPDAAGNVVPDSAPDKLRAFALGRRQVIRRLGSFAG